MKKTLILSFLIVVCMDSGCRNARTEDTDKSYSILRQQMVETQIKSRGVSNKRVLNAMLKVERHKFIPEEIRHMAYEDCPLPIGEGQTISQPYIVAYMTELLNLEGNEKVLEIGTGSGYQAAILAELCKEVYTIEIIPGLAIKAKKLLRNMNYKNIKVKIGDGYKGWDKYAPFDCIIVTCAPEEIPQPLIDQLAEGGGIVIPVGKYYQELFLVTKTKGELIKKSVLPVRFVPMIHQKK